MKTYIVAAFYYGLLFLGRKCLHATSQKRAVSHAVLLAVNYRLFSHGDVSYRFNRKNDNVVLECYLIKKQLCLENVFISLFILTAPSPVACMTDSIL